MNIVIHSVACHDQADRRDVEASRTVRISVAEGNTHRKSRFPKRLKNRRRGLLSHDGDYISRCHEPRIRESLSNCVYAKEMISVAMRRVNGGQILCACRDPFNKGSVLLQSDECID